MSLLGSPVGEKRALEWFRPFGFGRDVWLAQHRANRLKATARTEVVFLGDSITESWSAPLPWRALQLLGVEPCFDRMGSHLQVLKSALTFFMLFPAWLLTWCLGSRARVCVLSRGLLALDFQRPSWSQLLAPLNAVNMGIAGDRTRHLQWRVNHGELDGARALKVVALLIGINNLNYEESTAEETASDIFACAKLIANRYPGVKVLVQQLFPATKNGAMRDNWQAVNSRLQRLFQEVPGSDVADRLALADVGERFLDSGGCAVDALPDQLHLNEAGYRIWAEAVRPHLLRLSAPAC
mmetsp:Transcript_111531/g.347651  ORF Transcript_111531/g.347651 Transcript_111531/m.347651 type:complete len:296 (-) Transcript_111531:54-941(-)